VFLASCHSEAFGRIFSNVGIPHVICIDEETEMWDDVAIEFSSIFYKEVFEGDQTVCEAFWKTREVMLAMYREGETEIIRDGYQNNVKKFKILTLPQNSIIFSDKNGP
jgi:hypothetical protein